MSETISSTPPLSGFEEVPHTADWAYYVWGPDYASLFLQATQGLYALVGATFAPPLGISRTIRVGGIDYESLLVAWLNEVLHVQDSENLGLTQIQITTLQPPVLEATVNLSTVQQWKKDVKAVTYHNIAITPTSTGLEVTLVLDV